MAGMIHVEGLRALDRALAELDTVVQAELRTALTAASQPVKVRASSLAHTEISGMARARTSAWWEMRLGQTAYQVYLAPASRNRGGSPRPNLAELLMRKSMRPGLEQAGPAIVADIDQALDKAVRAVGF